MLLGAGGEGWGIFKGDRGSVWDGEKVLELDGGVDHHCADHSIKVLHASELST